MEEQLVPTDVHIRVVLVPLYVAVDGRAMVVTPEPLKPLLEIINAEAPQRKEALIKLEQDWKALYPMLVSDAGRVMLPLRPETRKA